MKTYYFLDDSWWDDNGCSCCEPIQMECYNIDTLEHPDIFQNGSAHSLEDCWRQVLEWEKVIEEDFEGSPREFRQLMIDNDLRVVII